MKSLAKIIGILFFLNLVLLYLLLGERRRIEITQMHLPLSTGHQAISGLRVVHLSDLQLEDFGPYAERILVQVKRLKPDVVCVSGDLIGHQQEFSPGLQLLNTLAKFAPVFFTFGNSDYSNIESFFRDSVRLPLEPSVRLLRNEITEWQWNGIRIVIAGLDDPITGHDDPEILESLREEKAFKILLTHAYLSGPTVPPPVDLVLSGHTHGGQMNFLPKPWMLRLRQWADGKPLRYLDGLHQEGETWIHVSRGLGESLLPIRFRAKPELSILTMQYESDKQA